VVRASSCASVRNRASSASIAFGPWHVFVDVREEAFELLTWTRTIVHLALLRGYLADHDQHRAAGKVRRCSGHGDVQAEVDALGHELGEVLAVEVVGLRTGSTA